MKRYPFIPFAICFVFGILTGKFYLSTHNLTYLVLIMIIAPVALYMLVRKLQIKKSNIIIFNISVYLGFAVFLLNQTGIAEYPFDQKNRINNAVIFGEIKDISLLRNDKLEFILNVDSIYNTNRVLHKKFNALCKITDERFRLVHNFYNLLSVGNTLKLKGTIARPKGKRNPGDFDYRKYLQSKNISALIYVSGLEKINIVDNQIDFWNNTVFQLRKKIDFILKTYHTNETYSLLRSLLLADRGELDYGLKQSYVNAGVVHVLAVSGLHVGFIVLIFLLLFNRLNIYLKYVFTITGVLFFLFLTGAQPPVFRASVMALIIIFAILMNRSTNAFNSLALAGFIILLLNPAELFHPGFQLSFSAVFSILFFYPKFQNIIYSKMESDNLPRKILLFAAVSLSAQIGTLPFTLYYFHKLSLVAIFINIVIIPVIGFILGLGIVVVLLNFISSWLAVIYASANNVLVGWMNNLITFAGNQKLSYISIYDFSVYDTLIFYFFLFLTVVFLPKIKLYKLKFAFVVLVVINFAVYSKLDDQKFLKAGNMNLLVFDAGRGQSVLINNDSINVLINAGNKDSFYDFGKSVLIPFFSANGIEKLHYGFITKVKKELYGGFLPMIEKHLISKLILPEYDTTKEEEMLLNEFLSYYKIPVDYLKDTIYEAGNIKIMSLMFGKSSFRHTQKNGIFIISYGDVSVLLADIETLKELERFKLVTENNKFNIWLLRLKSKYFETVFENMQKNKPEYSIIGLSDKYLNGNYKNAEKKHGTTTIVNFTNETGATLLSSNGRTIKLVDWNN